jgi:hypothetical protein
MGVIQQDRQEEPQAQTQEDRGACPDDRPGEDAYEGYGLRALEDPREVPQTYETVVRVVVQ